MSHKYKNMKPKIQREVLCHKHGYSPFAY